MNKEQIYEVLETCLLASDWADLDYLLDKGFNPKLAQIGLKLCEYLQGKNINTEQVL